MEFEIINFLSQYSVDCIAAAIIDCALLFIIKKFAKNVPEKINRLLPLMIALAIYVIATFFSGQSFEDAAKSAMTAGGLATVIYAFFGGLTLSNESELNALMKRLLKNLVTDEKIAEVTEEILASLASGEDENLTVIKISDLIRANAAKGASEETVEVISKIFVEAFSALKSKTKEKTDKS